MRIGRIVLACALGAAVASPALAAELFLGRWAKTQDACHGFGSTSLVATMTSVSWVDGYCRIGKIYKIGHAVYLQLHCSGKGDVSATLNAYGDRMRVTWGGAKSEELRRCK